MTRLEKFPYFISYFLGYRKSNHNKKPIPQWRVYVWSFLAAWIGIALLEIIFTYSESFQNHDTPMIVASFGATAVLVYGVIESPLAQPRNVIGGHTIGSIVGVIIAQLFLNIQHNWISESQKTAVTWVGGATAMALALNLMQLTKTVHPPAGASALIAVVTPNIVEMAWFYIAVVVVSAIVQVTIACLMNNVERRYPQYWWTPHAPIKIDPLTVHTLMPSSDEKVPEEVVSDNLTEAEEGRLQNRSVSSQVSTCTSVGVVEHALLVLRKHVDESDTPFALISPGLPIVATHGLLSPSEYETLELLLQKLNAKAP
ncbi:HPP family-domain-containing protein [Thamnidium elegans]|uniref:HPP transmembrane region domain-containing protein n=1 Tax=Thamnidium elegans TaxID=101142 RepID=A0A8H7VWH9_9FUNG|nr:hypothetical protein INT48_006424 [Thamnidium elegans]KAI8066058.1 HPP family-domain-containing protein [Thamnidium elegans]